MEIVSASPANGSENLPLNTQVQIVFDEEIDIKSVSKGGILLITSASKLAKRGPGFEEFGIENKLILSSGSFTGIVESKISSDDLLTVTLTPKTQLEPNREYTILVGKGVTTKTVGESTPDIANTGTGDFVARGPYAGPDNTYVIEIVGAGALGAARFSVTRESDSFTFPDPLTTDRNILIEHGLSLRFLAGVYDIGDSWTIEVFEPSSLEEINEFSFTTGSATFIQVPTEAPSINITKSQINGISRIDGIASSGSSSFGLIETLPESKATAVSLNTRTITLTFSKELDPDRIDEASIKVMMESLPIDAELMNSVELEVSSRVVGNKLVLTFIG
jgi:hypothetical protein